MTFQQFAFNNVMRNKRIYMGHFFSSTFAVMIFFTYGLISFHPNLQGELTSISTTMNTLGKIGFQVSQYLTFFFSFFFILYSVSAFLKTRKKEFGILMIHGMSHRQFNKLIFMENMLIGFFSIVTGIGIGLIFSKLILLISASILAINNGLSFYVPTKAIELTGISFFVLFLLISLFTSRMVKVNELVELLKAEEKPKPEPKASIWLALLSIISISAGYAAVFHLSVGKDYMTSNQLLMLIGGGVVLVVIGTYFLFTQLSVYVMHALKKNEHTFFKKTNLLTISELIYRLRDNAKTFFIVAIISAVAFTAIGICAAMANAGWGERMSPYAFQYESYAGNPLEKQHISEIKQQLDDAHFQYTLVSPKFITTANGRTLIKLTDYNEYAKKFGYKTETLQHETDSLVILPKGLKPQEFAKLAAEKNIELNHGNVKVTLQIIKRAEVQELKGYYDSKIVVNDSIYNQVISQKLSEEYMVRPEVTEYGFIIKDWQKTLDVSKTLLKIIKPNSNDVNTPYSFSSLSFNWVEMKQQNGLLSIMTVLVGIVFFIFATSFLYFRLFTDFDRDHQQYSMIGKIGLSKNELKKIVTKQMMLLFFLPTLVAMIHSSVAFAAVQYVAKFSNGAQDISVVKSSIIVLTSFLCMQIIYFFIIRSNYIDQLYKAMYQIEKSE
ncbi:MULTISPECIES: FtsX-like permease family protein [unclassified Bacillus (in: firmicutes)]|uniref:FtsX-like permease family protein n=1 Tax=unclassified Bacillus (in: firmicutes) TaxID=185979 RepID=UPI0008E4C02E|nr:MULTISPECIES: ABC transporter permease [unclassified Bacillus (in: firmicutes)]SFJ96771.1 putative ABC transport system permease protein [Bacillus sp. 71mf]SFS68869.1 putative ABC transport system permease protein [Bacillus sp. 103mf]